MADRDDRTFNPSQAETDRARRQGVGMGATELDQQRDPNRSQGATAPEQRNFQAGLGRTTNADRPDRADFGDSDTGPSGDGPQASGQEAPRDGWGVDPDLSRNEAGMGDVRGDLGAGTPANVDVHKLGQEDNPEEDWGDPAAEGTMFSSTNTNRAAHTETERGQGAKTRAANKDIVSRRT